MTASSASRSAASLRVVLTWLMVVSLAACGGGGSGGGGSGSGSSGGSNGNPVSFGTLAMTQGEPDIVGLAPAGAEAALSLAQAFADEVIRFASPSGIAERDCGSFGFVTISFADSDTSFSLSAGDTVTLDYDDCVSGTVNGRMTGLVTVAIEALDASAERASVSATAAIDGVLSVIDARTPTTPVDVTGAFSLEFSLDDVERLVVEESQNRAFSFSVAGVTESLSAFSISRTVIPRGSDGGFGRYRSELDYSLVYDSDLLGGSATCETSPLFVIEDNSIRSAETICRGRNASVLGTTGQQTVRFDNRGNGNFQDIAIIQWGQVLDGFLYNRTDLQLGGLFSTAVLGRISLSTTDIAYDASAGRLLATTAASDQTSPNALISISLAQSTQSLLLTLEEEPSAVAVSGDGQYLYLGFGNSDIVRKYDASTLELLSTVQIVSDDSLNTADILVVDLAVSPANPNSVAALFRYSSFAATDIAIITDDVQLPGRLRNAPGNPYSGELRMVFSDDGSRIYTFLLEGANSGNNIVRVNETGVFEVTDTNLFGSEINTSGNRVYTGAAEFDIESNVLLGTLGRGGQNVAIDSVNRRYYSESFGSFEVWDLDRRLKLYETELDDPSGWFEEMILAGDYLVFSTAENLRLLDLAIVNPVPDEECSVSEEQTIDGDAYTRFACDVLDAVYNAATDRIYLALTERNAGKGNSIAVIDPNTNSVEAYIPVLSNPGSLTLSTDGSTLFVGFEEAEAIVGIDTFTRQVTNIWQTGATQIGNSADAFDSRKLAHIVVSPVEPATVVALLRNGRVNSREETIAIRDGVVLADEIPYSAYRNNSTNRPQLVFDDTGALFMLHENFPGVFFESIVLGTAGVSLPGVTFDIPDVVWFPDEVSTRGTSLYFASGDVVDLVNQTAEQRFDPLLPEFSDPDSPSLVYAEPDSNAVWFLLSTQTGVATVVRFDDQSASVTGIEDFEAFLTTRTGHVGGPSIFSAGANRLGLIIDERDGLLVIDKSVVEN